MDLTPDELHALSEMVGHRGMLPPRHDPDARDFADARKLIADIGVPAARKAARDWMERRPNPEV